MNNPFKKYVYDLNETRINYFNTGTKNTEIANEILARMQTSLFTLVLAELAFLGALGLRSKSIGVLGALSITINIISLMLFFIGLYIHRNYMLRVANDFIEKSKRMQEYTKEHKKFLFEEIPEDFRPKYDNKSKNMIASILLHASYLGIATSSALLLVIVWTMVL